MKQIILAVSARLASLVPSLRYIGKNVGQLNLPQPPVLFPCCLIDIESVDFMPLSKNSFASSAEISLTIAVQHLRLASSAAPSDASSAALAVFDIISAVCLALDSYPIPNKTQPLLRLRLQKAFSDPSYDVYTLRYSASWVEQPASLQHSATNPAPEIDITASVASEADE